MTESMLSAELFKFAVFIGALALVRWNLYESFRVDAFRQRQFDLRRELFEYATTGKIGYQDAAYMALRNRINRLIRFAHTYSLVHLVLAIAFEPPNQEPLESDVAIEAVTDPEVRRVLTWINTRVSLYFAWHLICSSWFALALGLCGYAAGRVTERAREIVERIALMIPGLRLLERHAYVGG
jgi:hypothetical protein